MLYFHIEYVSSRGVSCRPELKLFIDKGLPQIVLDVSVDVPDVLEALSLTIGLASPLSISFTMIFTSL